VREDTKSFPLFWRGWIEGFFGRIVWGRHLMLVQIYIAERSAIPERT
jgi:hypothetical protein